MVCHLTFVTLKKTLVIVKVNESVDFSFIFPPTEYHIGKEIWPYKSEKEGKKKKKEEREIG